MPKPERDHRRIHSIVKQLHGGAMPPIDHAE
jgi:hypothetical protein